MNKLEKRYSENLELKLLAGEIKLWRFIGDDRNESLELAHRCNYTPDFKIVNMDYKTEYHETKGFMRSRDSVRLKVAARMYPQYKFVLVKWDDRKGWTFKEIPK